MRRFWFGLAVLLLVLAVLSARMLGGASRQMVLAQQAAARGDKKMEALHCRRAIAFYLPGRKRTLPQMTVDG